MKTGKLWSPSKQVLGQKLLLSCPIAGASFLTRTSSVSVKPVGTVGLKPYGQNNKTQNVCQLNEPEFCCKQAPRPLSQVKHAAAGAHALPTPGLKRGADMPKVDTVPFSD